MRSTPVNGSCRGASSGRNVLRRDLQQARQCELTQALLVDRSEHRCPSRGLRAPLRCLGSTAASSATCAISPVLLNAVLIGLSTAGAFAGAAAFTVFFDAETGVVFAVAIES